MTVSVGVAFVLWSTEVTHCCFSFFVTFSHILRQLFCVFGVEACVDLAEISVCRLHLHARFSQTTWSRPFLDYEQKQTPASFASLHRGRKVAPQSGHGFSAKPGWNLYEDNPKNVSCQMSVLVSTCRWVMCLIWNISACRMSVWASVFVVLKSNLSWLLSVILCLNLVQMCINLNMAPPWTDDKT